MNSKYVFVPTRNNETKIIWLVQKEGVPTRVSNQIWLLRKDEATKGRTKMISTEGFGLNLYRLRVRTTLV